MKEYCKENIEDVFIALNDFNTLDYGIRVTDLGEKQTSKLKYEPVSAYGQDGYTNVSEDAYEGFKRYSTLHVPTVEAYESLIDYIYIGREVKVYYSDDKGLFRYGTISNINDSILYGDNREIGIEIDLQPFRYGRENIILADKTTSIVNGGNVYATPLIKVYGNGKGKLLINLQTYELDIDGYLIMDSIKMDVFDRSGLRANSRNIKGGFARIRRGKSILTFTGGITKVEVFVNWRWR